MGTVSVTGGKRGESRTSKAAAEEHCLESCSQSLEGVGWKKGDLCVPMNLCPATRENSEQILQLKKTVRFWGLLYVDKSCHPGWRGSQRPGRGAELPEHPPCLSWYLSLCSSTTHCRDYQSHKNVSFCISALWAANTRAQHSPHILHSQQGLPLAFCLGDRDVSHPADRDLQELPGLLPSHSSGWGWAQRGSRVHEDVALHHCHQFKIGCDGQKIAGVF